MTTKTAAEALEESSIKPGHVYAAKKPAKVGTWMEPFYNDRCVIWISSDRSEVQFDSPTIRFGGKYKKISMADFLKWAGKDVTDQSPDGEWRMP